MKKLTKRIIVGVIIIAVIVTVCFVGGLVWGKSIRMGQANRDLTTGRVATARKTYEDLAVDLPESPYVLHNLGLAAYQQGQYQQAVTYLQKALEKLRPVSGPAAKQTAALTAKCYYHLGNAQFKLAEAAGQTGANSSGEQPPDLYSNALANFRNTLKITPAARDAKYNYELTKLRLDDAKQLQQQKDQDQSAKNNQQKKDDKQQNQPNKGNKPQNQNNRDQKNQSQADQKQSEDQKSQDNGQKGQKQPPNQSTNGKQGNSRATANQKRGMTKQEAQALLDAVENGDQYMAPLIKDNSSVQKDW